MALPYITDFLTGVQSNLNAEIMRIASAKRGLVIIRSNYKMSSEARSNLDGEIASLLASEMKLRKQYADIETYKYEFYKAREKKT